MHDEGKRMMEAKAGTVLITALDVSTASEALDLVDELRGTVDFFKVGSRLFTAAGPAVIGEIRRRGPRVFLDCKFHDIPATVAGAVGEAARLGVDMMTVHTLGGLEMMRAAAGAVQAAAGAAAAARTKAAGAAEAAAATAIEKANVPRPLIVGVTVLTSMSGGDLEAVFGRAGGVAETVLALARRAREAGLDGVVASVEEAAAIKAALGRSCVVVTPGIRPEGASRGDQKRVASPRAAAQAGSDFIVVGRPIIEAPSPLEAARGILEELRAG